MSDDVVIKVEGLWKRYGLPLVPTLKRLLRRQRDHVQLKGERWSLKNINFEVKRGETLGVVGHNGAGKSTLLKLLAGVSPATRGKVEVRGTIFPMLELNAGIHSELTGRENVRLLGAVMGLTIAEIREKMPAIEEFCELGDWFDEPVWKYSSGMLARLGFAVALNVNADILLVDEVLAVGDIAFQRKSLDRIEEMQRSGKTVLFVSHNIRQVERLCDRVLLLKDGEQVAIGETQSVVSQYYEAANTKILEHYLETGERVTFLQQRLENAQIEIDQIRLLDKHGQAQTTFYTTDPLTIEVEYTAHTPADDPVIAIALSTVDSFFLSGCTNEAVEYQMPLRGHNVFRCTIERLPLLNGIYTINVKIKSKTGAILGHVQRVAVFSVIVPEDIRLGSDYGAVLIETQWDNGANPMIPREKAALRS